MKLFFFDMILQNVGKEPRHRGTTVARCEFLWWSIVEHPSVHEVAGYLGCEDSIHRHSLHHVPETVSDDKELLIPSLSLDELTEDVESY